MDINQKSSSLWMQTCNWLLDENFTELEKLITKGHCINKIISVNGESLIYFILFHCNIKTLHWIIQKNINLYSKDLSGENIIFSAAAYNNKKITSLKFKTIWKNIDNIEECLQDKSDNFDENLWFVLISQDKNFYKVKFLLNKLKKVPHFLSEKGLSSVEFSEKAGALKISQYLKFFEKEKLKIKLNKKLIIHPKYPTQLLKI